MTHVTTHEHSKTPRLYVIQRIRLNEQLCLENSSAHYLKNVMRLSEGAALRIFNGVDGEWLATINTLSKKTHLNVTKNLKEQPLPPPSPLHLLFCPIKKQRMEFMIEKAVELGVTDLHPVYSAHTDIHGFNIERANKHIIEAAEQSERLDIPKLHEPEKLFKKLKEWPEEISVFCALERSDTPLIQSLQPASAYLIGPEGGFSNDETDFFETLPKITPISLGQRIYRTETAALVCLMHAQFSQS